MLKKMSIKLLTLAVMVFGSLCFAALNGGMGTSNAMTMGSEAMGCDFEQEMGGNLQCCVSGEHAKSNMANFIQPVPFTLSVPLAKSLTYTVGGLRWVAPNLRMLNTSSPPKNLPGVILKKE